MRAGRSSDIHFNEVLRHPLLAQAWGGPWAPANPHILIHGRLPLTGGQAAGTDPRCPVPGEPLQTNTCHGHAAYMPHAGLGAAGQGGCPGGTGVQGSLHEAAQKGSHANQNDSSDCHFRMRSCLFRATCWAEVLDNLMHPPPNSERYVINVLWARKLGHRKVACVAWKW